MTNRSFQACNPFDITPQSLVEIDGAFQRFQEPEAASKEVCPLERRVDRVNVIDIWGVLKLGYPPKWMVYKGTSY